MQHQSTATGTRTTRAAQLYRDGHVSAHGNLYTVLSADGGHRYTVSIEDGTCACADHQRGGGNCKHLRAAMIYAARTVRAGKARPRRTAAGGFRGGVNEFGMTADQVSAALDRMGA